jgi:hypothetical protein
MEDLGLMLRMVSDPAWTGSMRKVALARMAFPHTTTEEVMALTGLTFHQVFEALRLIEQRSGAEP